MHVKSFTRALLVLAAAGTGWLGGRSTALLRPVREVPVPAWRDASFEGAGMTEGAAASVPVLRVFGDYECPACLLLEHTLGDTLRALARAGAIRFVYHHAPLSAHARGPLAAAVAYCAFTGKSRWATHRALYDSAAAGGHGERAGQRVLIAAAAVGMAPDSLEACLQSGAALQRVARDRQLATALGVNAVPAVFLDGARLDYPSASALLRYIVQHSQPAREPRGAGTVPH
jgi:protein-disulfide isomerase